MRAQQPFLTSEKFRSEIKKLGEIQSLAAGNKIFGRGDPVRGVFLVCSGNVRLSLSETQRSRSARAGSVLGLPATIGNTGYLFNAWTTDGTEVAFVSREQLMKTLEEQPELRAEAAVMLGAELHNLQQGLARCLIARNIISPLDSKRTTNCRPVSYEARVKRKRLLKARVLLAQLKAEYDQLPDQSRDAVREHLMLCVKESADAGENDFPAACFTSTFRIPSRPQ
jgi:CRP-like cAMP-binding protein